MVPSPPGNAPATAVGIIVVASPSKDRPPLKSIDGEGRSAPSCSHGLGSANESRDCRTLPAAPRLRTRPACPGEPCPFGLVGLL